MHNTIPRRQHINMNEAFFKDHLSKYKLVSDRKIIDQTMD